MSLTGTRNIGRKGGPKEIDESISRGPKLGAGIHIVTVMANHDSTRRGRIMIWTESLGEAVTEDSWVQAQYASPYYSHTEYKGPENDFDNIRHSAGMWVPSPEVGSKVVVAVPDNDTHAVFWFGCIPERLNTLMAPGNPSSADWDALSDRHGINGSPEFKHADGSYDKIQPVGEFIEKTQPKSKDYYRTPTDIGGQLKPINYFTARTYKEQGLNADLIRGHTTSSGQRETPSEVFGISTKGRRYFPGIDESKIIKKLKENNPTTLTKEEQDYLIKAKRKPGHSFVMDDGELDGNNELIRLRSSSGHQVLLHDTKGVVYIGNAKGTVWMEFSNDGKVDLYSQDSVNVRTNDINFHADNNMSFYAGNNITMKAEKLFQMDGGFTKLKATTGGIGIDSKQATDIKAGNGINIDGSSININASGDVKIDGSCVSLGDGAGPAQSVTALATVTKKDTVKDANGFWKSTGNIASISKRIPTHEPFEERDIKEETTSITKTKVNTKDLTRTVFEDAESTISKAVIAAAKSQGIDPDDILSKGNLIGYKEVQQTVSNLSKTNATRLFATLAQNTKRAGSLQNFIPSVEDFENVGAMVNGISTELNNYADDVVETAKDNLNWWGPGMSYDRYKEDTDLQDKIQADIFNYNNTFFSDAGIITPDMTQSEVSGLLYASMNHSNDEIVKWWKSGGVTDPGISKSFYIGYASTDDTET